MASHRRGPWSQAEDTYLVQLVHTQGALNWVRIAQLIGSRSPKQCRERYHQNLKPSLNHEPISPEEGLEIERLVGEMGKRWAEIARRLRGRSDNAVKNWWNGSMNRRRRLVVRRRGSGKDMHEFDETMEPNTYARFPGSAYQPLTLTMDHSFSRHIDPSLPSPSASVISRADSIEGAPSLISDTGSAVSLSPRSRCSSNMELPPLDALSARQRSIPAVYGSPAHATEADAHYKPHSWNGLPTPTAYHPAAKTEQRQSYFDAIISPSQQQLPSAPPTPLQLPPMQMAAPQPKIAKDSRMNLSSLLG